MIGSEICGSYLHPMTDHFLTEEVPNALKRLTETTEPLWGEMNAVQMVDHLYNGLVLGQSPKDWPIRAEEEKLPDYRAFLMGPKPLPRFAPLPVGFVENKTDPSSNLNTAIERFLNEVPSFLKTLDKPGYRMVHPDFGVLNADQALMLNRKHVRHHLAQFGLMER